MSWISVALWVCCMGLFVFVVVSLFVLVLVTGLCWWCGV